MLLCIEQMSASQRYPLSAGRTEDAQRIMFQSQRERTE
jgi:hypothetical protein